MEKIKLKNGLVIKIEQEMGPINPRTEWDNLDVMVCKHGRYKLGDKNPIEEPPVGSLVLPLYLYDHSGITISTTPFSDTFDSGQVGYIYMTKDTIDREFGGRITDANKYMVQNVFTYDLYLRGEVYYFLIEDEDGEPLDSCGGFFGYEFCLESAKEAAKSIVVQDKMTRRKTYSTVLNNMSFKDGQIIIDSTPEKVEELFDAILKFLNPEGVNKND